jgi:hypothetical protein
LTQLREHSVCWLEQLVWHVVGFDVVPTDVIEGTTVAPVIVLMQVFWHACSWLLQPNRQVCEVAVLVGKMLVAGAGIASWVPAVDWSVVCAQAVPQAMTTGNASAMPAARRRRWKRVWRRETTDMM